MDESDPELERMIARTPTWRAGEMLREEFGHLDDLQFSAGASLLCVSHGGMFWNFHLTKRLDGNMPVVVRYVTRAGSGKDMLPNIDEAVAFVAKMLREAIRGGAND